MAANLTAFQLFQVSETTDTRRKLIVKMVDATDGFTEETGITFASGDVKISKNGAAFVNTTNSPTEVAFGSYVLELTATELNTLGVIEVRAIDATARNFYAFGQVIGFDIFDTTPDVGTVNGVVTGDVQGDVDGTVFKISGAGLVDIEDQIWGALIGDHGVTDSFGQRFRGLAPQSGAVSDAGATATDFDTNLTQAVDDFWNGALLVFYEGALLGQSRTILDYDGTSKNIILSSPFTSAPSNGNRFIIVSVAPTLGDTITELTGEPGKEPNIRDLLAWIYMISRDKLITDSGTGKAEVHNDAGTKIADANVTDSGTIFTRDKFV